MPLELLVVEDDDFTRITVTTSLQASGFDSVVSASTSAEALTIARNQHPRAALLDLHLGTGPTGLDVARQLRANDPRIGIVILTSYDDPRLLDEDPEFIPSGTIYLTKRAISNIDELVTAIRASSVQRTKTRPTGASTLTQTLNNNQLATLRLIAQGLTNAEIARRRGVTEKAVEGTVARLTSKLQLDKQTTSNQRVHVARVYFRALGMTIDDDPDQT